MILVIFYYNDIIEIGNLVFYDLLNLCSLDFFSFNFEKDKIDIDVFFVIFKFIIL